MAEKLRLANFIHRRFVLIYNSKRRSRRVACQEKSGKTCIFGKLNWNIFWKEKNESASLFDLENEDIVGQSTTAAFLSFLHAAIVSWERKSFDLILRPVAELSPFPFMYVCLKNYLTTPFVLIFSSIHLQRCGNTFVQGSRISLLSIFSQFGKIQKTEHAFVNKNKLWLCRNYPTILKKNEAFVVKNNMVLESWFQKSLSAQQEEAAAPSLSLFSQIH